MAAPAKTERKQCGRLNMLAHVSSMGLRGIESYPVLVELDLSNGLPGYTTVGLPDDAVRESRDRVISAVRNCGFNLPQKRITVNLAPGQSRKEGSHFDLPIALALLTASGQIESESWEGKYCCIGELALDGTMRPVRGALSMAMRARQEGFKAMIVPKANAAEARAVGIDVIPGATLREIVDFLSAPELSQRDFAFSDPFEDVFPAQKEERSLEDMADVKGQVLAKRAAEIAAAGFHNLIVMGPPGIGKSMLARRLPGILPPMSRGEILEVTRIHSARSKEGSGLVARRPFRDPHHSASLVSLVGGGPGVKPGEVSLAHGGVLFLDEVLEFNRTALESLRQPLSDFKITISRAKDCVEYPARFILVAALNPCPCGFRGHPTKPCICSPKAVSSYLSRVSGPLLDRIDLQVEMSPLDFSDWAAQTNKMPESSAEIRKRVVCARQKQQERLGREDFAANAYLTQGEIKRHCVLSSSALDALRQAAQKFDLSARGLDRVLKVSRTIADLEDSDSIEIRHIAEAMNYRALDKERNSL